MHHARTLPGQRGVRQLQAALQKHVGQVVFGVGVMLGAIGFQRVVLLAARQVRHVGNHQVVAPLQQPGGVEQAPGAQGQFQQFAVGRIGGAAFLGQRLGQQLAQRLHVGGGQVVLQAARGVEQAAQQRGLGKIGL